MWKKEKEEIQNAWSQMSESTGMSNNVGTVWESRKIDIQDKMIEWIPGKLSHVLLAENLKTKVKGLEDEIEVLNKKNEDIQQKIQMEYNILNNFQTSFVDQVLKQDSWKVEFEQVMTGLWFQKFEDFLDVFGDHEAMNSFLAKYKTEEERNFIKQALNDIYGSYLSFVSWGKKVVATENRIKQSQKKIIELSHKSDNIQKKIDEKVENIENLLSSWLLEQHLYIWNKAYLKDSVLWENIDSQLKNIIDMYKHKKYVEKHWLSLPKTLLLCWWPSSWKNFAANVLSTEMWRKMYHIKSQDIYTWSYHDPNAVLEAIFSYIVEKKETCIIFLDEIDKILDIGKDSNYQQYIWNTILNNISKIKDSDLDILVIWAITNKNMVDDRFFKYDNFSKQLFLPWIDEDAKWKLLKILQTWYEWKNFDFKWVNNQSILEKFKPYSQDTIKEVVKSALENALIRNISKWEKIVHVKDCDFDTAFLSLKETESKNNKYFTNSN